MDRNASNTEHTAGAEQHFGALDAVGAEADATNAGGSNVGAIVTSAVRDSAASVASAASAVSAALRRARGRDAAHQHSGAVRRAVIPVMPLLHTAHVSAATLDSRRLGNKSLVQRTIDEAVAAGMRDIVVLTPAGCGDLNLTVPMQDGRPLTRLSRIVTAADATLCSGLLHAADAVGDASFALLIPEQVIDASTPSIAQLARRFDRSGGSVLGLDRSRRQDSLAGRYIFSPAIFDHLAHVLAAHESNVDGADGAINEAIDDTCVGSVTCWMTAIELLAETERVSLHRLTGRRFDCSDDVEYLDAAVHFAQKAGRDRRVAVVGSVGRFGAKVGSKIGDSLGRKISRGLDRAQALPAKVADALAQPQPGLAVA